MIYLLNFVVAIIVLYYVFTFSNCIEEKYRSLAIIILAIMVFVNGWKLLFSPSYGESFAPIPRPRAESTITIGPDGIVRDTYYAEIGDKVIFRNMSGEPHIITGDALDNITLNKYGDTYTTLYDKPGMYKFFLDNDNMAYNLNVAQADYELDPVYYANDERSFSNYYNLYNADIANW